MNVSFNQFFQSGVRDFTWNEVEHIQVRVRRGRDGGAFYRLVFADGKRFEIFKIPVVYMKDDNIEQINRFLEIVSGKSVIKKRLPF